MYDKLKIVEKRYNELTEEISKPEVIADQANWRKLMKEHGSIEEIVNKYGGIAVDFGTDNLLNAINEIISVVFCRVVFSLHFLSMFFLPSYLILFFL